MATAAAAVVVLLAIMFFLKNVADKQKENRPTKSSHIYYLKVFNDFMEREGKKKKHL